MSLFEELGITREEVIDRVVDQIIDQFYNNNDFNSAMRTKVIDVLNTKVEAIAHDSVVPIIENTLANLTIQETNQYGEPIGNAKPATLREFIMHLATYYLNEPVDEYGRGKDECKRAGNTWYSKGTTRIQSLLSGHITMAVVSVVKQFLKNLTPAIVEGSNTITTHMIQSFSKDVEKKVEDTITRL